MRSPREEAIHAVARYYGVHVEIIDNSQPTIQIKQTGTNNVLHVRRDEREQELGDLLRGWLAPLARYRPLSSTYCKPDDESISDALSRLDYTGDPVIHAGAAVLQDAQRIARDRGIQYCYDATLEPREWFVQWNKIACGSKP